MLMLPCFTSKQTYARIGYLRTDGNWWGEKTLIMLKFLLKTIQNKCTVNTREWATARKTYRLETASASGCRACCSWATATASWKHRNNRPSASSFQLVETAWNNFRPTTFWNLTAFWHNQMGQNFRFHRIFVRHFVHVRGDYLGFTAQRHKLLSICRNTKIQDNFYIKVQAFATGYKSVKPKMLRNWGNKTTKKQKRGQTKYIVHPPFIAC